jgi:hypothetical protein
MDMEALKQLELPSEHTEETLWVKRLKEHLAAHPDERGNKVCYTIKMTRERHGRLLAAVDRHGMTITDLLTQYIDQVLPVMQRAKPVEVPGYKKDKRTKPIRVK